MIPNRQLTFLQDKIPTCIWSRCYVDQASDEVLGATYNGDAYIGTVTGEVFQRALILDGTGDYCFDVETEILTKNKGWIKFYDLTKDDEVATLNQGKDELEFQKPTNLISYHYKGKMVRIVGSKQLDLVVTPNHRVLVSHRINDIEWSDFNLKSAEEIISKRTRYKKACSNWKGEEKQTFILPEYKYKFNSSDKLAKKESRNIPMNVFVEFLGYFISEGHLQKSNVFISQCYDANKENWEKIRDCLDKLGYKYNYSGHKFNICDNQLANWLRINCYDGINENSNGKIIPFEIKQLSQELLKILFDSLMLGDGWRNHYFTISDKLADDFQEICLKIGYSANKNRKEDKIWSVDIQEKRTMPAVHYYKPYGADYELIDYDGFVYCCEVPNHIIYVRRNGKPVWCGNCDYGNNQILDISTHDRSIEFVINTTDVAGVICGKRNGAGNGWIIETAAGLDINLQIDDGTEVSGNNTTALSSGWHHVIITLDRSGNAIFYIDSVADGTLNISGSAGSLTNTTSFMVGIDGDGSSNPLDGEITYVALHNRVLSAAEVSQLAAMWGKGNGNVPNLERGLVSYWPLGNIQGTTVADKILSSGNDGTATSMSESNLVNGYTHRRNALDFDGSSDYVDMGDVLDLGISDATLSAWIKTASSSGHVVGMIDSGVWDRYLLEVGSNKLKGQIASDSGDHVSSIFGSATNVNDNNWHHVAITFDRDGDMTGYIDGSITGTPEDISGTDGNNINGAINFRIGVYSDGEKPFNGLIQDVRIYNRALTGLEAAILYDNQRRGRRI